MLEHHDAGALAEIAAFASSPLDYEIGAIELIGRRIGFDVAMFKRRGGVGLYTPGLDPRIARGCVPHFRTFAEEIAPVATAALAQRGVAVDVEVLGMRRMERLSFYQLLMRPHGGTSTALVYLMRRGAPLACLALGRTRGSFAAAEVRYLESLAPTLSLAEAAVLGANPPLRGTPPTVALSPREREILAYLPLGHTNAQIATALGTAERTVRNQLSRAYEKLGVASRAEAVALCIGLGLSRPPPA